jgi:hypothetical protein
VLLSFHSDRKKKELSSDMHGEGFYKKNNNGVDKSNYIDMVITGLPKDMTGERLREIVGA